jgi:hypothetical protein
MFVRWKRRERVSRKAHRWKTTGPRYRGKEAQGTGKFLLVAVLVRSERRNGRPRQKTLAYLGSIAEDHLADYWPRRWFWESADRGLGALGLDDDDRQKVEAALQARVRRPTAEETAAAEAERKKRARERVLMSIRCGGNPLAGDLRELAELLK